MSSSFPLKAWREIGQGNKVLSPFNAYSDLHQDNVSDRKLQYSTSSLYLYYLYNHFGKDAWLVSLMQKERINTETLFAHIDDRNSLGPQMPQEYLRFNSVFLNFVMALALNTTMGSRYDLFSLSGSEYLPDIRSLRLQAKFEFIEGKIAFSTRMNAYEALHIQIESGSQCLQWTGSNKIKVYRLKQQPLAIDEIPQDNCFDADFHSSSFVMINFGSESDIVIADREHP